MLIKSTKIESAPKTFGKLHSKNLFKINKSQKWNLRQKCLVNCIVKSKIEFAP